MKKWIGVAIALAALGTAWYLARTYWRITPEWMQPKFGRVTHGDIQVPVTAAGRIEPKQRIEIKSEASGEVIEIRVQEGDFVRKGDVLVRLKPDDEQRNVERARAGLDSAEAQLAQARVAVERARADLVVRKAQLEELQAQVPKLQEDLAHEKYLIEQGDGSQVALKTARMNLAVVQARIKAAEASIRVAENNLRELEQAIRIREAAVKEQQKVYEDALQRLKETKIVAPTDGIVTHVMVSIGTIVQSGRSGFSLGTPILTLADISHLKVIARVDEADYGRVLAIAPLEALPEVEGLRESAAGDEAQLRKRTGRVRITVDAFPEESFEGRIRRVEPEGRRAPGSTIIQFAVHVEITDERRYMLPLGAQAQVEFTVESVRDALLVPADAVKSFEGKRGVWVKSVEAGSGRVRPKFVPCRFGITDGAVTQVIEVIGGPPLKEGQEVYTRLPRDDNERG